MSWFVNGLRANVMSTQLIMEANVSKKVLFKALDIVKEFESTYSAYREDSLLNKINSLAGVEMVTCNAQEVELFEEALKMAEKSDGRFDPTIGVLTQGAYGFGKKHAHIPDAKELQKMKKLVNYKNLQISQGRVFLSQKGMRLDLGGIGKGFIAQKLFFFLQKQGATKILVNVGGEVCSAGKNYSVAIANPFNPEEHLGVIKTLKTPFSISTSGDYERFIGSRKNHHILDNTTAVQNHFYSSMSILKNGITATMLDAVATIAFNTPHNQLETLAKKYEVAIIAVAEEGKVIIENFTNLDLQSLELFV